MSRTAKRDVVRGESRVVVPPILEHFFGRLKGEDPITARQLTDFMRNPDGPRLPPHHIMSCPLMPDRNFAGIRAVHALSVADTDDGEPVCIVEEDDAPRTLHWVRGNVVDGNRVVVSMDNCAEWCQKTSDDDVLAFRILGSHNDTTMVHVQNMGGKDAIPRESASSFQEHQCWLAGLRSCIICITLHGRQSLFLGRRGMMAPTLLRDGSVVYAVAEKDGSCSVVRQNEDKSVSMPIPPNLARQRFAEFMENRAGVIYAIAGGYLMLQTYMERITPPHDKVDRGKFVGPLHFGKDEWGPDGAPLLYRSVGEGCSHDYRTMAGVVIAHAECMDGDASQYRWVVGKDKHPWFRRVSLCFGEHDMWGPRYWACDSHGYLHLMSLREEERWSV